MRCFVRSFYDAKYFLLSFSDRFFDGNFVKKRYIHVFCEKSTSNLLTFDIVFSIILVGTFFLYSPFYRTWEIL